MRTSLMLCLLAAGCGSSPAPREAEPPPPVPPPAPSTPTAGSESDAPEISRSVGKAGGVVVLWPRIVLPRGSSGPDAETRRVAQEVQQRLAELARRAAPGRDVDVRPEPERVCPRTGCAGASVGALVTRIGGGCAVLALVTPSGASPARIVPWLGTVKLDQNEVAFREHAERHVHVTDYASCDKLAEGLGAGESAVQQAVQGVVGR